MQIIIAKISRFTYKIVLKPLIFKFVPPDQAHQKMISFGKFSQKSNFLVKLVNFSWNYQNHKFLSQKIMGIEFKNPVGLSAGFDKNFEITKMIEAVGFGFMEGGSITFNKYSGNKKPWFYRLPKSKSIVVNAGLPSIGTKDVIKNITKTKHRFPLNVSVAKTNSPDTCSEESGIDDYVSSLKLIKKSGVGQIITLNISCPNVFGGEPFTTPQRLEKLLSAVDKLKLKQPIFIKMPIDKTVDEFLELVKIITKHNVAGVTISNLFKQRQNIKLKDKLDNTIPGNLSGKPTSHKSNLLIKKTYQKFGDKLIIIGVGGIFDAKDAYKKIKAGASVVEMITGLMFEGPQVVGEINRDLVKLLKKDGYTNIKQAIGSSLK